MGKTTLANSLAPEASYLNWDDVSDREAILRRSLPDEPIWILDELHKYKQWRSYSKGFYDKNKGKKR